MFENAAIISPGTTDGKLNVGRVLDAMLYYKKVEFIVDQRSFSHLWRSLGPDGVYDLLSHPSLRCKITPEMPVIQTEDRNGVVSHRPQFMSHAGRDEFRISDRDTVSKLAFGISEQEFRQIRPKVKKLVQRVGDTRYRKLFEPLPIKGDLFKDLISDSETMRLFLRSYAHYHGAHCNEILLQNLKVTVYDTPFGFVITSNIPPTAIIKGHLGEGWQSLLPMIHDYQLDLRFAQSRSADLICGQVSASISSQRLDLSLNRATRAEQTITAFEQFAFSSARPFGKSFEEGAISLKDALQVIDKTAKFREWLSGMPVDVNLVEEFNRAVSKETILDKLPGRISRFSVFTGAGVVIDTLGAGGLGTAVGIGLSAVDSFVVDSMLKGWRPSNFVDIVQDKISTS